MRQFYWVQQRILETQRRETQGNVRQGMSTDKGIEIFGNLANGDTLVNRATDETKSGSIAYWKLVK